MGPHGLASTAAVQPVVPVCETSALRPPELSNPSGSAGQKHPPSGGLSARLRRRTKRRRTPAHPIMVSISRSMSKTGETNRLLSGGASSKASMLNQAPRLVARNATRFQRARAYAIKVRSSGTACQGSNFPVSPLRSPCPGKSMAITCHPRGQAISAKAPASSLYPCFPWIKRKIFPDSSPSSSAGIPLI